MSQQPTPLPFRSRFLRVLGPAVVVVLGLLCLLVWLAAYVGYAGRASAFLEAELRDVTFQLAGSGRLEAERYRWDEPHHVISDRRSDPLFLQVFDADGALLRQSANIQAVFRTYPTEWLGEAVAHRHAIARIHEWTVDGEQLNILGTPMVAGDTLGFIQVGRFVPDERALIDRLAWILLLVFGAFSAVLLGLIHWSTTRFVRPLETITRFADGLDMRHLDSRVQVTSDMDRETLVLSRTLNGLLERVEESMVNMRQFTANAAHELRTPLTVMKGHVDVSLRRDRPAEQYRETLELVGRHLGALVDMVAAMLLLARLDRSGGLDELESIRVADFIEAAVDEIRTRGDAPPLSWSVEGDPELKAQPDLIMRVLVNLLDNAVRYGDGAPVDVSATGEPGGVRIVVADQGPGFPEELDRTDFHRFRRGQSAIRSGRSGAGLGLAIVDRIVRLHGGTVEVESDERGTRVSLFCPFH